MPVPVRRHPQACGFEGRPGQRLADQIALHFIAAEQAQEARLLYRFDALCAGPWVMSATNDLSIFSVSTGSFDR